MQAYFAQAPAADAAWALHSLTGGRVKGLIAPRLLASWGCERGGVPGWLFEESFGVAGDLAETIALLVDTERQGRAARPAPPSLSRLIEDRLLPLRDAPEEEKDRNLLGLLEELERREVVLLDQLLNVELRVCGFAN